MMNYTSLPTIQHHFRGKSYPLFISNYKKETVFVPLLPEKHIICIYINIYIYIIFKTIIFIHTTCVPRYDLLCIYTKLHPLFCVISESKSFFITFYRVVLKFRSTSQLDKDLHPDKKNRIRI